MKRTTTLCALLVLCAAAIAQTLYVGSYNIRYRNSGDSLRGNAWSVRCNEVCGLMAFERPDAFGTQEGLAGQLRDMDARLHGYARTGRGRDDGREAGEHSAIYYNTETLSLLKCGDFWLSETPDVPSRGWDAALPRICSWALFRHKESGRRFYFFNLHMDHIGTTARSESAKLVVRKIREIAGKVPVVLTGDFNVDQRNPIYSTFTAADALKDCYECARERYAPTGTFNSFNPDLHTESRIDHIFVSPSFDVRNYGVLTCGYWGAATAAAPQKGDDAPQETGPAKRTRRTASDHYPVLARLRF